MAPQIIRLPSLHLISQSPSSECLCVTRPLALGEPPRSYCIWMIATEEPRSATEGLSVYYSRVPMCGHQTVVDQSNYAFNGRWPGSVLPSSPGGCGGSSINHLITLIQRFSIKRRLLQLLPLIITNLISTG